MWPLLLPNLCLKEHEFISLLLGPVLICWARFKEQYPDVSPVILETRFSRDHDAVRCSLFRCSAIAPLKFNMRFSTSFAIASGLVSTVAAAGALRATESVSMTPAEFRAKFKLGPEHSLVSREATMVAATAVTYYAMTFYAS